MSVNPKHVNDLHEEFFVLQKQMFLNNNKPFFSEYESLIRKYSPKNECKTFVIGDVFCHGKGRKEIGGIPPTDSEYLRSQYHHDNFTNWYITPCAKKEIRIDFTGICPLSEFVIPCEMNTYELQNRTRFTPMSEELFSLVLYALIIEPSLGKRYLNYELIGGGEKQIFYLFPVQLDGGNVVMFDVIQNAAIYMWDITIRPLPTNEKWSSGEILLSFK